MTLSSRLDVANVMLLLDAPAFKYGGVLTCALEYATFGTYAAYGRPGVLLGLQGCGSLLPYGAASQCSLHAHIGCGPGWGRTHCPMCWDGLLGPHGTSACASGATCMLFRERRLDCRGSNLQIPDSLLAVRCWGVGRSNALNAC